MNPKVSVCIPTYNYGYLIEDALKSVLHQNYNDYEIIIIDNASSDNTEKVVKSFDDKRIKYFKNKQNIGFTKNLNRGLELAVGEYIVYLCADDYWLPNILEKEVEVLESHPTAVLVHTGYRSIYRIKGRDEIRRDAILWPAGIHNGNEMIKYFFKKCVVFVWPMVRRKILQILGGFDERMTMAPENHMWLRVVLEGDVAYIPEPLYAFRYHGNNLGVELQKKGIILEELLLFSKALLDYVKEKDKNLYEEVRSFIYNFPFRESYRWLLHSRTFMGCSYKELFENSKKIIGSDAKKLLYFGNLVRLGASYLPRPLLRQLSLIKNWLTK